MDRQEIVASVREALRALKPEGFSRDIVDLGIVAEVDWNDGHLRVGLRYPPQADRDALADAVRSAAATIDGVDDVLVTDAASPAGSGALPMAGPTRGSTDAPSAGGVDPRLVPGIARIVAVASGKGGVGKSTVAVNLAVALARLGVRVGLLDADVYGPSIPLMLGATDRKPRLAEDGRRMLPFERLGVRFMSLGFLVEPETAVIWRGPMVMKALEQLLREVEWGELDLLVVDMPPGTGDAQLTMSQRVALAGAIIVTTPQDVALADAIKGIAMFRKVEVPVLGLVENMSYFVCPHCDERTEIFGHGGGKAEASRRGIPFLSEIPLDAEIRRSGDEGSPVAALAGDPRADAFLAIAGSIRETLFGDDRPAGPDDAAPGGLFERFARLWSPDRGT